VYKIPFTVTTWKLC